MNTTICDAETSDLADSLAPAVLIWCQDVIGWPEAVYSNRAIDNGEGVRWCLSELVPMWMDSRVMDKQTFDGIWEAEESKRLHAACPWQ